MCWMKLDISIFINSKYNPNFCWRFHFIFPPFIFRSNNAFIVVIKKAPIGAIFYGADRGIWTPTSQRPRILSPMRLPIPLYPHGRAPWSRTKLVAFTVYKTAGVYRTPRAPFVYNYNILYFTFLCQLFFYFLFLSSLFYHQTIISCRFSIVALDILSFHNVLDVHHKVNIFCKYPMWKASLQESASSS